MTDQERAIIYLSGLLRAAERVEETHEGLYREYVRLREEVAERLQCVRDNEPGAIAETLEAMAWIEEGQP